MACDAFLSEALYEADKALEKLAAAPRECGWRTKQTVNRNGEPLSSQNSV